MRTRDRVLRFLTDFTAEQGWPPTVREIAHGVGLGSPSTVHVHLVNLERDGLIVRGHTPRTIRVVQP